MRSVILLLLSVLSSATSHANESAQVVGKTPNEAVEAHREYLQALPKDNAASIANAVGHYLIEIAPLPVAERTQAFLDFLNFHDALCRTVKVPGMGVGEEWDFDLFEKSAEVHELNRYGLEIRSDAEGGGWIRGIPDYIPRVFGPHVAPSVQRYLALRQRELEECYCFDGALVVAPARLAERLGAWEQYLLDYPNSLLKEDVRAFCALYVLGLVGGASNSSPFEDGDYYVYARDVLGDFLSKHRNTPSGQIIEAFYEWLMADTHRTPDEIRKKYHEIEKGFSANPWRIWPAVQVYFRARDRRSR